MATSCLSGGGRRFRRRSGGGVRRAVHGQQKKYCRGRTRAAARVRSGLRSGRAAARALALSKKAKLGEYAAKRTFSATPEPAGVGAAPGSGPLLFVIQQHSARRLHYD